MTNPLAKLPKSILKSPLILLLFNLILLISIFKLFKSSSVGKLVNSFLKSCHSLVTEPILIFNKPLDLSYHFNPKEINSLNSKDNSVFSLI